MSTIFFVVNQDPADGSAHGLYCLRNCWWLAAVKPEHSVRLVHPRSMGLHGRPPGDVLRQVGLSSLPNLHLHALPALRKSRGRRGITVNVIYFWALLFFLRGRMKPKDILAGASFPKLMRFLYNRGGLTMAVRRVYEVHQLAFLEHGPLAKETAIEREVLSGSDTLLTTTQVLRKELEQIVPGKPVVNLGLACAFEPGDIPERIPRALEPFTLAYIGSLYPEQGVDWLVRSWAAISRDRDLSLRLIIAGGSPSEVKQMHELTKMQQDSIAVHGPVHPKDLPAFLKPVDALIIPALARGRMPYVALTKAYDYLGLHRPVLAADLPSVAEVLRHEHEALLFAPGNAAELAEALARVAGDIKLVRTLVGNCRKRRHEFSWESRSKAWWEAATR